MNTNNVLTPTGIHAESLDEPVKIELTIFDKQILAEKDPIKREQLKVIRMYCFEENVRPSKIDDYGKYSNWCDMECIREERRMSNDELEKQGQYFRDKILELEPAI